jgi:hypothetical protein
MKSPGVDSLAGAPRPLQSGIAAAGQRRGVGAGPVSALA